MVSNRDAQLRVLLPSGGQSAIRAADDTDPERSAPDGRADRMDQHDVVLDACGNDGRCRISRRPFQQKVDNNAFAHRLVADDRMHGLHRRLRRGPLFPLDRNRRRRKLLRAERLRAHRRSPQGDAIGRALNPPGGALCWAYGLGACRGVDAWAPRHVAKRLHRVRCGGMHIGRLLHLGFEGRN